VGRMLDEAKSTWNVEEPEKGTVGDSAFFVFQDICTVTLMFEPKV